MAKKKIDNIVDKWKQTKNKKIVFKNDEGKVNTRKFDLYKIFENYLNKEIDYRGISNIGKSIKNGINIYQEHFLTDRMNDKIGYDETAEEADSVYMKGNNDNELKLIKNFITKINNGTINNENKAGNEFRKLKQKVTNDRLRQDLIKDLERYTFGEELESIEPEEKYGESVAERVKTRPRKISKATADYLEYEKEQKKGQKRFSDDYDSNGSGNVGSKSKGTGLKISTDKQMLNRLPILLAQIQAGNNSIKLKNEIRQILYSLYRSKVLTKAVYNNLIKSIRT